MLWGENRGKRKGQQSNPGPLWLEPPVLCHWTMTARRPPTFTSSIYVRVPPHSSIFTVYCRVGGRPAVKNSQWLHKVEKGGESYWIFTLRTLLSSRKIIICCSVLFTPGTKNYKIGIWLCLFIREFIPRIWYHKLLTHCGCCVYTQ